MHNLCPGMVMCLGIIMSSFIVVSKQQAMGIRMAPMCVCAGCGWACMFILFHPLKGKPGRGTRLLRHVPCIWCMLGALLPRLPLAFSSWRHEWQ
jgi:hypothetical protein